MILSTVATPPLRFFLGKIQNTIQSVTTGYRFERYYSNRLVTFDNHLIKEVENHG